MRSLIQRLIDAVRGRTPPVKPTDEFVLLIENIDRRPIVKAYKLGEGFGMPTGLISPQIGVSNCFQEGN